MAAHVRQVQRLGGDRLLVAGWFDGDVDAQGNPRLHTATGWASHMTNYHPPADYNADGSLKPGAVARAMTAAERTAYWQQLLTDAAGSAQAPAPTVVFDDPTGPQLPPGGLPAA